MANFPGPGSIVLSKEEECVELTLVARMISSVKNEDEKFPLFRMAVILPQVKHMVGFPQAFSSTKMYMV